MALCIWHEYGAEGRPKQGYRCVAKIMLLAVDPRKGTYLKVPYLPYDSWFATSAQLMRVET